ncbi:PREDICTED: tigger transposable element-derived protein 4-like isoform X2 [Priapulus caudatus]|uniref:Tigger transposable element-derived protein 4-like isoform X2 n=1 Tax=Priapulus caudatus TaxID=37621 RepID=A0ABM1DP42_PRICU|nr:PREDICTED: tigger transposable element-derived protein 4-like isoform X2 [Priapulus caudatus]
MCDVQSYIFIKRRDVITMTSFGWKRKAGESLQKSSKTAASVFQSAAGEPDFTDVDHANLTEHHNKRRRHSSLEDKIAKSHVIANEGAQMAEQGRYTEAIGMWNKACTLTPYDAKLHEMKAQAYLNLGEPFCAVKAAEMALSFNPVWWVAHQTHGRALISLGEALRSFSRAVHLQPDNRELWEEDLLDAFHFFQSLKVQAVSNEFSSDQNIHSNMASAKKRVDLPLSKKVEVLRHLELPEITQVAAAKKYGISTSQISRLLKAKAIILADYESGNKNRKRKREGKEQDVGHALHAWFQQKLAQGARPTGPILKNKAKEIASAHGSYFAPSEGWLCRWKLRHNITFKKEHSEKQHEDLSTANESFRAGLAKILEDYSREDIFNAGETGLYFRDFPEKGYCENGGELLVDMKAKERFTVMLCANMSGTEKLPLLVIAKSKAPRSFPKDLKRLPVSYDSSRNAWMTEEIFHKWVEEWDRKLRLRARHVCLLVDNCSAHPHDVELTNISVRFLPTHVTSIVQPMDIGVIRNWKGHYRSKLSARINASLAADNERCALDVASSVSVLDALHLANESWDAVLPQTIAACYWKAFYRDRDGNATESDDVSDSDILADVVVPQNMTEEEFADFIRVDDDLAITGEMSDASLLEVSGECVSHSEGTGATNQGDSDHSESEDQPALTSKQKVVMVNHLRRFVQENGLNKFSPIVKEIESLAYSQVSMEEQKKH